MQKANQNKKLIKLMSVVLSVLTISTPASLATKPIQLEDEPGILEKLKSFALPAAIIGGAVIITGATIYGISKIKESKNKKEFIRSLYLALQGVTNRNSIASVLEEIEKILESKIENSRMDEFKLRFEEFKNNVQSLDDIDAAKRELLQGLHAIVKTFNIRFDINEFNNRKSNKSENTAEEQPNAKEEVKIESDSEIEVQPKIEYDSEIKVQSKIEKNEDESSGENNKLKLPEEFDVFEVAIIGSDIEDSTTIKIDRIGEKSLNEVTVEKLCSCKPAKKLSEYEGITVKDGKIFYKNQPLEIPEDSIYLYGSVFSFHYVNNCDDANRILPRCQYAICPFIADLDENLNEHLIRLKNFVKLYQPMCDIRFLYYTKDIENSDRLDDYVQTICNLCVNLYTLNGKWLQQDIGSKKISTTSESEDYKVFLKHIAFDCKAERAKEFKDWTGNDVLHINRYQ